MSAVPKKKLCWNCEGNVSRQVDNCPYCGVYLHAEELEQNSSWNPSYNPSTSKTEEIPSPLYQIQEEEEVSESEKEETIKEESISLSPLFAQLKQDIFPILFLMMGSIFFLFGIVLYLFSNEGTLTLQWQGSQAPYFLLFSLPLMGLGYWFFQNLESNESIE